MSKSVNKLLKENQHHEGAAGQQTYTQTETSLMKRRATTRARQTSDLKLWSQDFTSTHHGHKCHDNFSLFIISLNCQQNRP